MISLYWTYQKFQKIMKFFWLDIAIKKTIKHKVWYESIFPYASYAPWLIDDDFKKTFKMIENYSLVDKYRCYELRELVWESAKLSQWSLIEIWARRWWSAALIAKKALLSNINEKTYICDTFTWVVKATDHDSSYIGGEHADTSKKTAEEIVNQLNLKNIEFLVWVFPEDTWNKIENEKFRFCHIDVDVYQSAKDCVERIWPKLVSWGMIVFDDYWFITCDGIVTLMKEERLKQDRIIIHNLNGHAIIVKL